MLSTLLAQASDLPDPKSAAAIGWLFVTLGGACLALNQIASFYFTLKPRKTPPDHEVYATKAELETARKEHQESDERIEKRFEQWMEQEQTRHTEGMKKFDDTIECLTEWRLTIERALGVVGTKADIALETKGKK